MLAYFTFLARNTLDRKGLDEEQKEVLDSYLSHPELPLSPLKKEVYRHLPLSDWVDRLKDTVYHFADFLKHPTDGPSWRATDLRRQLNNVNVPMLRVGSWYDAFQYDTLTLFSGLRERATTAWARQSQKLLMGPWGHFLLYSIPTSGGTGDIDFGPEARIELQDIQLRWFDYFLKGQDAGVLDEAPIRLFVMGDNRWRDENEWPLALTQYTDVYLHSGGKANSLNGDGTLSLIAPNAEEHQDAYVYDPQDPVPTRGGTTLGMAMGVLDQNKVEVREDALVFTGDLLNADIEVTGPIALTLYAASSASDTDFTAKLADVRPGSYAQNIAEGVIRARFRESLSNPTATTPGKEYGYMIDLWATSYAFKASHRLRLDVSSSNIPRYERNPDTEHDFGVNSELRSAQQTIFHNSGHPSDRTLPVNLS